jgi:hypothetical protein
MFSKNTIQKFIPRLFILALLLSSVHAPQVSAQSTDGLKRQVNAQSGRVSFIGPESGRALPASRALGTFIRPQDPAMALAKRFARSWFHHPEHGLRNQAEPFPKVTRDEKLATNVSGHPGHGRRLTSTRTKWDVLDEREVSKPCPTQPEIGLGRQARFGNGSGIRRTAGFLHTA